MIRNILCVFVVCLGITIPGTSQEKHPYDTLWRRVDQLSDSLGLPRTALDSVGSIYTRAREENNMPQVIKALLYRVRLEGTVEEDMGLRTIRTLEAQTDSLPEPARSILQSLTAGAYQLYYQQKRFEILSRTAVQGGSDDINTWSAADFGRHITALFAASLKDPDLLKRTKADAYQVVLDKGNMGNVRPTLYDVLANRAIQYFSNDEQDVTVPLYTFALDDSAVFAAAREFSTHLFYTPDSTSHYWQALLLYQDLLRFHQDDKAPNAFIDADINRLAFARQYAVQENKEDAYRQALDRIIAEYPRQQATAQAYYLLGVFYYTPMASYLDVFLLDSAHKFDLDKALGLFDHVIKEFPSSIWVPQARLNAAWIRQSDIHLEAERVVVPGKPFLGFVKYRNTQMVSFRLIRSDSTLESALYGLPSDAAPDGRTLALRLGKAPVYRSWTQALPCPPGHTSHGADIKIDALPIGSYILLASVDGRFGEGPEPLAALPVHVSDIAWISAQAGNVYLVNRQTGAPLSGAKIRVWDMTHLYGTYYSDKNGHFKVERKDPRQLQIPKLDINTGSDSLFVDDPGDYTPNILTSIGVGRSTSVSVKPTFLFFADREIYRPGQTVYFKAIGLQKEKGETRLYLPQEPIYFYLESQGQKIDSLLLHPGEFGSAHGSFHLPEKLLDGRFQIVTRDAAGGAVFSVEEYKRPRFSVSIHPLTVPARLGDTIHLTGQAIAFAGHEVDGATVRYTVTRTGQFHYGNRRIPFTSFSPAIITRGSVRTGSDGAFTISFPALADRSVQPGSDPTFDFRIQADITDINGESHTTTYLLPLTYKALTLRITIPNDGWIPSDSIHQLSIESYTRSIVFQPLQTTVKIIRLQTPDHLIRPRYASSPDQFPMDRETFHRFFPHEDYRDEADMSTWPVAGEVMTKAYQTDMAHPFSLDGKHLEPGVYRIVVTATDPSGLPLREEATIKVYDPETGQAPYPAYEWGVALKNQVKPGDSTRFILGTGADSLFIVTQRIHARGLHVSHKYLFPAGKWVSLSLRPEDADYDGISYGYAFVKDNRLFTHGFQVFHAPDKHELKIHYTTFRDRLEPGNPETWTLSIQGPGKAAADAEVLASMYDASLDQFQRSVWAPLTQRPLLFLSPRWGSAGFSNASDKQESRSLQGWYTGSATKQYNDLPLPYTNVTRIMIRGRASGVPVMANAKMFSRQLPGDDDMTPVGSPLAALGEPKAAPAPIPLRQNFNETAFFYPDLRTDSAGNVSFSFTSPEALTTWKFRVLAHTRDLDYGLSTKEVITQKTLMLEPNLPRFFRAGDKVWFSVKVVYNGAPSIRAKVSLSLFDAITMQPVDKAFDNLYGSTAVFERNGDTARSLSVNTSFFLRIPAGFTHPVVYRLTAASDNFSDGEQGAIPVVSRNLLVTETTPIFINGDSTHHLNLDFTGGTPYRLTLEYSSNPTWYAVQAIPSLLEAPHECLDYTFNRYYAGAIGEGITRNIPGFAKILDTWKKDTTGLLKSALEKDSELKSVLLEETPWVLDAAGESAQKQRLATLLDTASLGATQAAALRRLIDGQETNGAFAWFKGGYDDPYITRYIVTGLGRLRHLGLETTRDQSLLDGLIKQALGYLDATQKPDTTLGYDDIEYLYTRSYFPDQPLADSVRKTRDHLLELARHRWQDKTSYEKATLALSLYRSGDTTTAHRILASLEETSIPGRYWKNTDVSAQAVLIEAFEEISGDMSLVNQLRTWLLAQKETKTWPSSTATADACYALLINRDGKATEWLSSTPAVKIKLGDTLVESHNTGIGYIKRTWDAAEIHPSMGQIQLTPVREKNAVPVSWGGVYYQSFRDIDSIPAAGMMVRKEYYVLSGTEMRRVTENDTLHVGDRVRVRLVFSCDQDMDYVHLGDLRAGCMEPLDVHSGYHWQGGLSYYQTTMDLSTHWYFSHLTKGSHLVEYDLFVERAGVYSGGIATLECLYAPQFSGHSQGGTLRCN